MDDFEELKPGESVWVHLVAGATAGVAEHCGMFPIDTIKTNLQALPVKGKDVGVGTIKVTQTIIGRYGFLGLFRGISAMASGAAPAHAMHFATYEFCKKTFQSSSEGHHPIATGISGIFATIVSDAILTPMDSVKQRLQLRARGYKGLVDCFSSVVKHEGFRGLYAGYTTTLTMNIPYNAVYFASYESLRRVLKRGSESEFDVFAHMIAGGGAGSFAAAMTNPLDVAKTRLQTQGDVGRAYKGMVDALITIWKEEGMNGYTRGLGPRVALHSLSAAICWITYEWTKNFLNRWGTSSS